MSEESNKEGRNVEAEIDEAVRHIRALEARVLILEQSLDSLLKKLGV